MDRRFYLILSRSFMQRYKGLFFLVATFLLAFLITQLGTKEGFFITGTTQEETQLSRLFYLLSQEKYEGPVRFTLVDEITRCLKKQGNLKKVNLFLTTYVANNPQDQFNAYHLFEVAENYRSMGASKLAIRYYEKVLRNRNDLIKEGESLHFKCLKEQLSLEERPFFRKRLFEELRRRFNDKMTTAGMFYQWGYTYETLGLWDEAVAAYQVFSLFPDSAVTGEPKASQRIRSLIDYFQVGPQWVRPELDQLVADFKRAVLSNHTTLLESLRAKVGFSTLSWDNSDVTDLLSETFDIRTFLKDLVNEAYSKGRTSVLFSSKLDEEPGDNAVYLRSTGWNYRIPVLYFHFRRINYPIVPEIHGSWEWAGIYFGEKL